MRLSFQYLWFFQNAMHRSLLKPTFPDLIPQQKEDAWSDLLTTFIQNKKLFCFTEQVFHSNFILACRSSRFHVSMTTMNQCTCHATCFTTSSHVLLLMCRKLLSKAQSFKFSVLRLCNSVFLCCRSILLYQCHFELGHLSSEDLGMFFFSFFLFFISCFYVTVAC